MYYGWRRQIGLIYPGTSPAGEMEFHKFLPDGVALLTNRILLEKVDPEGLGAMEDRVVEAAGVTATAKPDIIVFACTSGSLIKGYGYDQRLIQKIQDASGGIPALTTTTAMVEGLKAVGAKKVAVSTPYCKAVDEAEKKFLEDSGIGVTDIRGLGITDSLEIPKVTPDQIYRQTMELDVKGADAVFISCTGIGIASVIPMLERDLGLPVVTSNQTTLWLTLRRMGIKDDIPELGRLFKL